MLDNYNVEPLTHEQQAEWDAGIDAFITSCYAEASDDFLISRESWIERQRQAEANAANSQPETDYIDTAITVTRKLGNLAMLPARTYWQAVKWGVNRVR